MGFPFGADEDAAFIISWLELNNLKGISLLQSLLNKLDQQYDGTISIKNLNENIDFNNTSILMKGPGLIDYMHSVFNNRNRISLEIKNCNNAIFFLPLLYKISKNINYSKLYFCNNKKEVNVYEIINNEIRFSCKKNQNNMSLNRIKITMDRANNSLKRSSNKKIISEKIIQKNLSNSLSPKKIIWEDICKLANQTFVPESEESRIKGAGGGDAND